MVFQHPALLDSLSVYQNISFGLRTPQYSRSLPRPLSEEQVREIVLEKIRLVNLGSEVLERMPPDYFFSPVPKSTLGVFCSSAGISNVAISFDCG